MMELFLQFGWGMKTMTLELAKKWSGVSVVLSPRDIEPQQIDRWRKDFEKHDVRVLFDPQCYFPKSHHPRLAKYSYWEKSLNTYLSAEENDYDSKLIEKINEYNERAGTSYFIIPSIMERYGEKWLERWYMKAERLVAASLKHIKTKKKLLTLALPADFLVSKEDEIEQFIQKIEELDVDGFYIVAEPPRTDYLVDNPLWLSNVLQLCAGLKLLGKKVLYGYANQQMLCLSAAGVDAIASGSFLNVRQFSNKFEDTEGEVKRKSTWFYNPESLSEYKISFLDVAFNNKVLNELRPSEEYDNEYIKLIFSGIMPSTTEFKENLAFKHYLETLRRQIHMCSKDSFDKTISHNELMLEIAEQKIKYLEANGVYAQNRSFKDMVDVNRSAIQRLKKTRGFMLKHSWANIIGENM